MGWEENKHEASSVVVHSSSIALLQERFRELQRVKEMREERELVKLMSLSNPKKHNYYSSLFFNNNNNNNDNTCVLFEPPVACRFFCHPELMMLLPPTPTTTLMPPQTSLSLWPTSPSQSQAGKKLGVGVDVPPLMNLWPPADTTNTSNCDSATSLIDKLHHHDHHSHSHSHTDDIDTSLHL